MKQDDVHRGGWVEHEPTGRAVVQCTCGLDSDIVAETQAVQVADDHRRTAAEARSAMGSSAGAGADCADAGNELAILKWLVSGVASPRFGVLVLVVGGSLWCRSSGRAVLPMRY
ncbi:hypothetical protein ABZ865_39585 [Streptomyces sp. NPDC047085]|uniref:hypothetical protein n=1 Tax=Streptomyces sp. NPDC047085 TaxID=3155140 RepID=UPI0033F535B5